MKLDQAYGQSPSLSCETPLHEVESYTGSTVDKDWHWQSLAKSIGHDNACVSVCPWG